MFSHTKYNMRLHKEIGYNRWNDTWSSCNTLGGIPDADSVITKFCQLLCYECEVRTKCGTVEITRHSKNNTIKP